MNRRLAGSFFMLIFLFGGSIPLTGGISYADMPGLFKKALIFVSDKIARQIHPYSLEEYGLKSPFSIDDIRVLLFNKKETLFTQTLIDLRQKYPTITEEQYKTYFDKAETLTENSRYVLFNYPSMASIKKYDESTIRDPEIPVAMIARIEELLRQRNIDPSLVEIKQASDISIWAQVKPWRISHTPTEVIIFEPFILEINSIEMQKKFDENRVLFDQTVHHEITHILFTDWYRQRMLKDLLLAGGSELSYETEPLFFEYRKIVETVADLWFYTELHAFAKEFKQVFSFKEIPFGFANMKSKIGSVYLDFMDHYKWLCCINDAFDSQLG